MTLDPLYRVRFPEADRAAKNAIWQVLCRYFFQRYVNDTDVVLDLGPGLGEFLSNIRCASRIAVDIEKHSGRRLPAGTTEVEVSADLLSTRVPHSSVDVVFCSNFFEHLPNSDVFLATLREIRRVLRPGGRLLILQPNIRLIGGAYWDFVDHHLALTDRTLIEACESTGLRVTEVVPRFLPYTTRSALPQSPWLVRVYLAIRPAWFILGKQTWLVAQRPSDEMTAGG